ncbi:AAA family ATPase [Anaerolineales bacterium HSG24]|nr:AAA family ATPase [Anaerolineales bacterium HSG24]
MNEMKNLPIGDHTFESLISGNSLYIDKTEYIYNLLKPAKGVYFLSRPRRFGKSLLVSTLAALFEGKRELFKGLWIDQQSDYDFEPHPVFQIDMSRERITDRVSLEKHVWRVVDEIAEKYQVSLKYDTYSSRFTELIRKLSDINKVVILIDEYDKPILDNLHSSTRDEVKETLRGFYGSIKASDPYLRFVLLTGVSKFARVSVFSDLNNLLDLSMDIRYAEMLGITQDELEHYFAKRTEQLADQLNISPKKLLARIAYWYDGYRFSTKDAHVYNPFSTLLLFEQQEFKHHWFETGTPTFLIELIKRDPLSWPHIYEPQVVSERAFSTYEIDNLDSLPLLFQTGYLTIKDVIEDEMMLLYELDYPNFEVRNSFLSEVLSSFSGLKSGDTYIYHMDKHLQAGEVDRMMETLQVFFANVNYDLHLKYEKYYQTIFFVIFELLKFKVDAEVKTERGRVDVVVEVERFIYLFEFKLTGTKDDALKQIKDKQYYRKYLHSGKEIIMVGAAFDQKKRNIEDWEWEIFEEK